MKNGWHEGTIGIPINKPDTKIAHYWVKTAEEDQEEGMGRILKMQVKIDGKNVINYDRGWDIKPDENDPVVMVAYSILLNDYM